MLRFKDFCNENVTIVDQEKKSFSSLDKWKLFVLHHDLKYKLQKHPNNWVAYSEDAHNPNNPGFPEYGAYGFFTTTGDGLSGTGFVYVNKQNETFVPKRVSEREEDNNLEAKNNKLKGQIKKLLQDFHAKKIDLDTLETALLTLNIHDKKDIDYQFYIDWIKDNIADYKNGQKHVLSLTSSGSILASLEN